MTRAQVVRFAGLIFLAFILVGCGSSPTKKISSKAQNRCDIRCVFKENPKWRREAEKSAKLWGTSVPVIMAIIYKESTFKQHARPINKQKKHSKRGKKADKSSRHNGHGKYLSSAYGYAQALTGTWDHYRRETGRKMARRNSFADCAHFIGWYSAESYKRCGIRKNDAYHLYLAYHEGHEGFNRRMYKKNKDVMTSARTVSTQAKIFDKQLKKK